jgi:FkbM family methyltransferase
MIPFRARFAAKCVSSPQYFRRLEEILSNPFRFYNILIKKLWPGTSRSPLSLHLKDGTIVQVEEFWTLFLFDEIFVQNCYEPPQVRTERCFSAFVDIGANIGLCTLRVKQLWPEVPVLAVEPHPDNFRRLREHIDANHLHNVSLVQGGIGDKCGCMDLYLSPRNIAGHSMYKKTGLTPLSVPIYSFSDLLNETYPGVSNILLKVDCEGCEQILISSMTQEVADRISCVIFEPERSLYNVDDLLRKLISLGYRVSEFLNLVVADRDPHLAA